MSRTQKDRDFRKLRQLEKEMMALRASASFDRSYHASKKYAQLVRDYEHLANPYGLRKKRVWSKKHNTSSRHVMHTLTHKLRKAKRALEKRKFTSDVVV